MKDRMIMNESKDLDAKRFAALSIEDMNSIITKSINRPKEPLLVRGVADTCEIEFGRSSICPCCGQSMRPIPAKLHLHKEGCYTKIIEFNYRFAIPGESVVEWAERKSKEPHTFMKINNE